MRGLGEDVLGRFGRQLEQSGALSGQIVDELDIRPGAQLPEQLGMAGLVIGQNDRIARFRHASLPAAVSSASSPAMSGNRIRDSAKIVEICCGSAERANSARSHHIIFVWYLASG